MNDELYGVLFRDQGVQEYLVFADESEETAERQARRLDEVAFDDAVEKHANEPDEFAEPVWEDYEGMHYIEPIARTVVEEFQGQLDRGFVVRVG